jgi:hypothetical protein
MRIERTLPVFTAAFAVIYLAAVENNLALFTYHPRIGEWGLLAEPPRSGPAMYWYGWIATSLVGAAAASLAALPLTAWYRPPAWVGWAIPLAVMIAFVYFLRVFLLR